MLLTALSSACSQTYPDSVKRNIIKVGMRYDSLQAVYYSTLAELKQRELEIQKLEQMLSTQRSKNELLQTISDLRNNVINRQKQLYDKIVKKRS